MSHTVARRTTLLSILGLALPVGLAGCDDDSPKADDPEGAARLVTQGLTALDLSRAPITGTEPTAELRRTVAGMHGTPRVQLVNVGAGDTEIERRATVQVTWTVAGRAWTYPSSFVLKNTGNRWEAPWAAALVHPQLRPREQLSAAIVPGRRGDILGAGDTPLVTERGVFRIGVDRSTLTGDPAPSARALAAVLQIDPTAYASTVTRSGPKAFVPAITLRTEAVTPELKARIDRIDGVVRLRDDIPLAPTSTYAAPVLGKVGPATKEIVDRSKGAVRPDQQVGLSGLQARYDKQLSGTPGLQIRARIVGPKGVESTREVATVGARDGAPLRITLDDALQRRAEALLTTYDKSASAIVAIKPSTGELLAVASGPGSKGNDTARLGRYAPGSTFKVVSSLALVRSGLAPDDPVECSPTITSSGRVFRNFPDYPAAALGAVPYRTAVANSCNTAIIRAGQKINNRALASAAESLGMTQKSPVGFLGSVPAEDTGAEHDASMIGQGRLLASPVGMATVAASAVSGRRVEPTLVVQEKATAAAPGEPLTANETGALRGLMRAVVTEGGARELGSLPGPPVYAKTGTAEYGTGNPPGVISWMIAAQGDLSVAVMVQDGGYGGVTCLPIVRSLLQAGA